MNDEYKTIESPSEGIYKEKGSKFLAFAYPVYSIDEIKEIVAKINKDYYDARHRCYAWKLGLDENNFRANDDGEPSGTAGKPIYGQLLSHELTNILVVVVRYFGGIKLGTSGLIYAYKTATADAIANATIISKTVNDYYTVCFSYEAMNDVMKVIKDDNVDVHGQEFDLQCKLKIVMRKTAIEKTKEKLEKITSVKLYFDGSF